MPLPQKRKEQSLAGKYTLSQNTLAPIQSEACAGLLRGAWDLHAGGDILFNAFLCNLSVNCSVSSAF